MRWWKTGCLLLTRACTNQTPQIYFYGNDDPLARLDLLDSYLDEFEAIKVDSAVTYQPKKTEPWTLTKSFPATEVRACIWLGWWGWCVVSGLEWMEI